MKVCEMVWTPQRARDVSAEVERVSGRPCPCKAGLRCPFVKAAFEQTGEPEAPEALLAGSSPAVVMRDCA